MTDLTNYGVILYLKGWEAQKQQASSGGSEAAKG